MIKAESVDKKAVITVLTESFDDNQSVNFVIMNDKKRTERIQALMDYSFEICKMFGDVWMSDDRKACALILYPKKKRTTIKSVCLDIWLILKAIGFNGICKTLSREAQIQKIKTHEPVAYLWFIGVDPKYQQKGIGSKLLQEIIENSNEMNLPLCLETSTLKNLPWYQAFGFEIYNQLNLGYTLFFLKRPPEH